jgi:transcriptional regulator with XRE-family HTH domain
MSTVSNTSNPIDVHVGQRLRSLRLSKELTQEELGDLVGVSYQQIQKYETGANRISASRLYLLACRLEVGPEYFFNELDAREHSPHVSRSSAVAAPSARRASRG